MNARNFVITIVVATLFLPSCLSAEDAPCSTRTLLVNVIDQEGKPVQASADSFRGKYRGHPVDILSVTSVTASRRIVLLLDASGSMQDGSKWEAEQLLAKDIVAGLPESAFALMVFGSGIQDKVGFAQGPVALAKKLNNLSSELQAIPKDERKTALYDAILAALDELSPPREGDTIYVITDGGDNKSTSKPSQVERRLLAAGVRLFTFLFVDHITRSSTPQGTGSPQELQQLVHRTGAAVSTFGLAPPPNRLSHWDLDAILWSARQLYPIIQQSYRLEVKIPADVDKPRDWNLEVLDQKGKKAHYSLIYPRLEPCAAHQP